MKLEVISIVYDDDGKEVLSLKRILESKRFFMSHELREDDSDDLNIVTFYGKDPKSCIKTKTTIRTEI